MKKLIFHFFMSMFLIVIVSACGSSSDLENKVVKENKKNEEASNEAKPKKLIIWEEKGKAEALKPVIEAFEKEYGIKVEHKELEIATEMYHRLRRDGPIGNGKAPDVVTFSHDKVGRIVKEGLIQEVKVNEEVINAFIESSIRGKCIKIRYLDCRNP